MALRFYLTGAIPIELMADDDWLTLLNHVTLSTFPKDVFPDMATANARSLRKFLVRHADVIVMFAEPGIEEILIEEITYILPLSTVVLIDPRHLCGATLPSSLCGKVDTVMESPDEAMELLRHLVFPSDSIVTDTKEHRVCHSTSPGAI